MIKVNIDIENLYEEWELDINSLINNTKLLLLSIISNLRDKSCLVNKNFKILSLDVLLCDSTMTHSLNREYRNKDYAADIITFAIFADDENKFIYDGEINLGEIVIALDKIIERTNIDISKSKNKEQELIFLICHGLMHLLGFDHQSEEEYNFVIEQQNIALRSIGYDKIQGSGV